MRPEKHLFYLLILCTMIVNNQCVFTVQPCKEKKHKNIEILGINDQTPLHTAVSSSHLEATKFLLEQGADVNARDALRETPLHYACATNSSLEIIELLINHGGMINAQNMQKRTPLHKAVGIDAVSIVKYLVEHGAEVTAQDVLGITPLHLLNSCTLDNKGVEIAKILICNSYFPNNLDEQQNTRLPQLQELGMLTVLKTVHDFKHISIDGVILPFLARDKIIPMIVRHLSLEHQKKLVALWKEKKSEQTDKQVELLLSAHCQQYLYHIKRLVRIKGNCDLCPFRDSSTTECCLSYNLGAFLEVGLASSSHAILLGILNRILNTQNFTELEDDLQQRIKKNLERRLGISS